MRDVMLGFVEDAIRSISKETMEALERHRNEADWQKDLDEAMVAGAWCCLAKEVPSVFNEKLLERFRKLRAGETENFAKDMEDALSDAVVAVEKEITKLENDWANENDRWAWFKRQEKLVDTMVQVTRDLRAIERLLGANDELHS